MTRKGSSIKRFIALLGIWAIGEGLVLTLLPRRYLSVWAGMVTDLIAQPRLMQRPRVVRLVGVAELGFGVRCGARCLGRPAAADR